MKRNDKEANSHLALHDDHDDDEDDDDQRTPI